MAKGSWTFHERLAELRERLGHVRYGSKSAMARELGIHQVTYGNWESGAKFPKPEVLRAAIARLGVHEEEQLVAYLLDTFGTVPPPAWWNQRCPVPRVKDGPWLRPFIKTPPPKPGERPWLPNQDLLDVTDPDRIDEDEPEGPEPAEPGPADEIRPLGQGPPEAAPKPVHWKRLRELATASAEAQLAGDEATLARLAAEIRALLAPPAKDVGGGT